uniref:Putative secreted protein n=1 Tax=Xenopsylla cheopis TaxID=163159 RepID=A0A6M2E3R3_XENCH
MELKIAVPTLLTLVLNLMDNKRLTSFLLLHTVLAQSIKNLVLFSSTTNHLLNPKNTKFAYLLNLRLPTYLL